MTDAERIERLEAQVRELRLSTLQVVYSLVDVYALTVEMYGQGTWADHKQIAERVSAVSKAVDTMLKNNEMLIKW